MGKILQDNELNGVETPAIELLCKMGWERLRGKDLKVEHRNLAPIILSDFKEGLLNCNPWIDEDGINSALIAIRKLNEDSLMATNKKFWEEFIYKSEFQVKVDVKGINLDKTVKFIDSVNIKNNKFRVVDQYVGHDTGENTFRPDLLLFVNGIPLGIIECKASAVKLSNGISQIISYQKAAPKQFYFNQLCVAINRNSGKYGAIGTPEEFYFKYRLEEPELKAVKKLVDEEPSEQDKLLWAIFEPSRFIELVKYLIIFDKDIKKVPRYQQWRTVNKTVERLKNNKGGVVWHTQGSGKSLTMALLTRYLRAEETGFNNPSILILTDRTDLDRQIFDTFTNVGLKTERARSVEGLQSRLGNDYGGIFTSTIQKFQDNGHTSSDSSDGDIDDEATTRIRRVEKDGLWFMLEEVKDTDGNWITEKEYEVEFSVLSKKKNFYVLVDEAHRSHYGFLGAIMRASLPNAKLVAFTGTPLIKEDKNTLVEFDGDDYIDVYALLDAVKDNFTLPIKYIDGVVSQTVGSKLDSDFEERTKGLSESKKALLKKKLLKDRRLSSSRLREVCLHLINEYENNGYKKGFKAMLVCEGRAAAVKYKEILDSIMADRASNGLTVFDSKVVISLGSITANRTGESGDSGSIEERVREAVNAGLEPIALPSDQIPNFTNELFKLPFGDVSENRDNRAKYNNTAIVIVSDMLLTGYDAPILNTLYLDKPLKEHTLLQAIARVNRTCAGKHAGYIVDYYGIVPDLDSALEAYGGNVPRNEVLKSPEEDIPNLEAAFDGVLKTINSKFDIDKEPIKFLSDAERRLDIIESVDIAEDFLEAFSVFNRILSVILPNPRVAKYKPYFIIFSKLKASLLNILNDGQHNESVSREESKLLSGLIDEYVKASPVESLLNERIDIFNREELTKLKKINQLSQAVVMKNQLKSTIGVGLLKQPGFFGLLEEELNKLLQDEKAGRIEQSVFIEQMGFIINKIRDKDNEAENAGFKTPYEVTVYNYLKENAPEYATAITKSFFNEDIVENTLNSRAWKSNPETVAGLRNSLKGHLNLATGWDKSISRDHSKKIVNLLKDE